MIIASHKNWVFGSFLIFSENQFTARRARETLIRDPDSTKRTGVLMLPTGEMVRWTNLDLPYK